MNKNTDLIRKTFAKNFKHWKIELPEVIPSRGSVENDRGWLINYVLDEKGLEYYAGHRMTNSRLELIDYDGNKTELRGEQEFYGLAVTEEKTSANRQAMIDYNNKFYAYLKERGLSN